MLSDREGHRFMSKMHGMINEIHSGDIFQVCPPLPPSPPFSPRGMKPSRHETVEGLDLHTAPEVKHPHIYIHVNILYN